MLLSFYLNEFFIGCKARCDEIGTFGGIGDWYEDASSGSSESVIWQGAPDVELQISHDVILPIQRAPSETIDVYCSLDQKRFCVLKQTIRILDTKYTNHGYLNSPFANKSAYLTYFLNSKSARGQDLINFAVFSAILNLQWQIFRYNFWQYLHCFCILKIHQNFTRHPAGSIVFTIVICHLLKCCRSWQIRFWELIFIEWNHYWKTPYRVAEILTVLAKKFRIFAISCNGLAKTGARFFKKVERGGIEIPVKWKTFVLQTIERKHINTTSECVPSVFYKNTGKLHKFFGKYTCPNKGHDLILIYTKT